MWQLTTRKTQAFAIGATAIVAVLTVLLLQQTGSDGERASTASTIEAAAPAAGPRGVLTLRHEDGTLSAVRAEAPGIEAGVPANIEARLEAADTASETYPSPNGRAVATVRFDDAGTWLEVTQGDSVVATYALSGIVGDQLVNGGKTAARGVDGVPLVVAWSPDSSRLAFGSIAGAPWTLNLASSTDWTATAHEVRGGYVGELAWAPDSALLAISTYELDRSNHSVLLYDPQTEAVSDLVDGCKVVWSPDGEYVAVHREPHAATGVWIAAVRDALRVEISPESAAFPVAWTSEPTS
ncbi:MAG: hypothetical protein R3C39_14735 [Dehalococcoidia bacterium]